MELNDLYTTDISYEGEIEILAFDTTFDADIIILESDGETNIGNHEGMD